MILQASNEAPIIDATTKLAEKIALDLPLYCEVRASELEHGAVIFQALAQNEYRVARFVNQGKQFDRTYGARDTAAATFADQIALLG